MPGLAARTCANRAEARVLNTGDGDEWNLESGAGFLTGVLLGVMFFGGLWWTVQHGVSSERVALWFVGSMVLRTRFSING